MLSEDFQSPAYIVDNPEVKCSHYVGYTASNHYDHPRSVDNKRNVHFARSCFASWATPAQITFGCTPACEASSAASGTHANSMQLAHTYYRP